MKRILIADDSMFMRGAIRGILTRCGYLVIGEAENGKMAVEKYKELSPDIVTLDITMDKMSGLEALKLIIEHDPDAVVVMVSAMGQESIINEAIETGAKGFLIKPFKMDAVIATISKIVQQQ